MIIDSHCHLDQIDLSAYDGDLTNVIDAARAKDVAYMLCVCVNMENFADVLAIADSYVNVFASVGVHPTEQEGHDPSVKELITHAQQPVVVAIGETGLDYYHCKGDLTWQQQRFRRHIQAAIELDKPLIVHSRDAAKDTIKILQESASQEASGVFHCFSYDEDIAKKVLDLGFYISLSGIVTFKNAKQLHEVAKTVPLDRLLIETDAPYLAPEPYRGKTNQPAYVRYVAERIAQLRGIDYQKVAEATTHNFFKLFNHAKSFRK